MAKRIIAIGGEPATGKTSLMRGVLKNFTDLKKFKYKLVRGYYSPAENVYIIGIYNKELFSGTDKLSMAVQPSFIEFLPKTKNAIVIFEGDRLFNQSLFEKVKCDIYILQADEQIKHQRHIDRKDSQDQKFLKAKQTKIKNIKNKNNFELLINNSHRDLQKNIKKILKKLK
tara:strand:- start:725 stop:1237 length:513 start_codon:yes stop_codon:yes gene_type:complete